MVLKTMELQDLKEILACLRGDRTKFYYFRDRYALMLLKDYLGDNSMPVNVLKKSPYANLLNKAPVKKALSLAGDGIISAQQLDMVWDENPLAFVLTLSQWGEGKKNWQWNQMSRPGYHLVLQINMATDHSQHLQRLIRPNSVHHFNYWAHPSLQEGDRGTLAWVRLDLDLTSGEVLIEEIQNDWIRRVRSVLRMKQSGHRCYSRWLGDFSYEEIKTYADDVLAPYTKIWEEAMLSATIDFIHHELGLQKIYYHSFEQGALLKHIKGTKPPRSLYTRLPKQFGFQKTNQGPEFLMREKRVQKLQKKVIEPYWFKLPQAKVA